MTTNGLQLRRRDLCALAAAAVLPPDLTRFKRQYAGSPREASLAWFRQANRGLFIHYGLYSLDGVHPFHQHRMKIPVAEYEKRMARFTAERFDADRVTALAVDAGMKYVNLVTKHCEGFCLWDTRQTEFSSMRAPARRDLVAEMATACRKRKLGLFLFYEHGFDWRHPHAPRFRDFPIRLVEVPYDPPEPSYAYGANHDLQKYVAFAAAQITELLTNYGPVAGIWLDGAAVPRSGDWRRFHLPELYDTIHRLQPQALVSYKFGITGTEDFLAPERPQLKLIKDRGSKPMEMCVPLNPGWGYVQDEPHLKIDELMGLEGEARKLDANLLVNVGPVGDGSVLTEDVETLREFGKRIRAAEKREKS